MKAALSDLQGPRRPRRPSASRPALPLLKPPPAPAALTQLPAGAPFPEQEQHQKHLPTNRPPPDRLSAGRSAPHRVQRTEYRQQDSPRTGCRPLLRLHQLPTSCCTVRASLRSPSEQHTRVHLPISEQELRPPCPTFTANASAGPCCLSGPVSRRCQAPTGAFGPQLPPRHLWHQRPRRVPPWRTGRGPRATLQALHSPDPRPTRPQPPGPSVSSRLTFPGTCTSPPPVRRPSAPLLPATLLVPTAPGNLASSVAARENQKLNGANSRLSLEAVPEPWRRRTHGPSSANLGPCPPPLPPRRPERPVSGLNGTAVPKGRPHCAPSVLGLRQRGRRPPLLEREI